MIRKARASRTVGAPPTAAMAVVVGVAGLAAASFLAGAGALLVLVTLDLGAIAPVRVAAAAGATVGLGILGLLIAAPVAIGTAVWTVWLAPAPLGGPARAALLVLADVPPIVWAVAAIADPVSAQAEGALVFASLGLGAVAAPAIARRVLQAIERVPASRVLAARALGLTAAEAVHRVVLPSAARGILRAVLLGAARAFTDAIVVLVVLGGVLPWSGLPLLMVDQAGQPAQGAAVVAVVWVGLAAVMALAARGVRA